MEFRYTNIRYNGDNIRFANWAHCRDTDQPMFRVRLDNSEQVVFIGLDGGFKEISEYEDLVMFPINFIRFYYSSDSPFHNPCKYQDIEGKFGKVFEFIEDVSEKIKKRGADRHPFINANSDMGVVAVDLYTGCLYEITGGVVQVVDVGVEF